MGSDMNFQILIIPLLSSLYHHHRHHHHFWINSIHKHTLHQTQHSVQSQFSLCEKITRDKIPWLTWRVFALTPLPKMQISLNSESVNIRNIIASCISIHRFINNALRQSNVYKLLTMSRLDTLAAFSFFSRELVRILHGIC